MSHWDFNRSESSNLKFGPFWILSFEFWAFQIKVFDIWTILDIYIGILTVPNLDILNLDHSEYCQSGFKRSKLRTLIFGTLLNIVFGILTVPNWNLWNLGQFECCHRYFNRSELKSLKCRLFSMSSEILIVQDWNLDHSECRL